jgi:outer membrane protein W
MIAYGDRYGQLAVDNSSFVIRDPETDDVLEPINSLTFGIFGGDAENGVAPTQLKRQTYLNVMTGVEVSDIDNTWAQTTAGDHRSFGTYNGMLWMLRQRGHEDLSNEVLDDSWNLEVLNIAETFFNASASAVNQQMSGLQGMIDTGAGSAYDCNIAAGRIGCVSVKGGYVSEGDGASEGVAAVVGSIRLTPSLSIGAFLQQGFAYESPDNLDYTSTMPSVGGYLAFSQHEDNTGIQAKLSAATSNGEAKISRENLLGPAALASGKADINGYALAQTFGYGFGIDNSSVITPYVGIGYVSTTRGRYDEESDTSGVDDVFDYSSYNQNATIGAVGVAYERDNHDGFTLRAGAGLSYIFNPEADDLEATSNVPGIERLSARSTYDQAGDIGVTGYLGTDYAITDNQKIGFDAGAWRSVSTGDYGYWLMAGWTLNFGSREQPLGK